MVKMLKNPCRTAMGSLSSPNHGDLAPYMDASVAIVLEQTKQPVGLTRGRGTMDVQSTIVEKKSLFGRRKKKAESSIISHAVRQSTISAY